MSFSVRSNRRSAGRKSSGLDCGSVLRTKPPNCKNGFLGVWRRVFRSPSGTNSQTFRETVYCQLAAWNQPEIGDERRPHQESRRLCRNCAELRPIGIELRFRYWGPRGFFCAFPNYRQAKQCGERVNVVKYLRVEKKWRSAAVVERKGRVIRDQFWIARRKEHSPKADTSLNGTKAGHGADTRGWRV